MLPLDTTEKRIRELVPSLDENCISCDGSGYYVSFHVGTGDTQEECEPCRATGKVGHPIQLHHVLQAVSQYQSTHVSFSKSSTGYIEINQRQADVLTVWDLTKPYSEQSEEVKDFIGEIIKN